MPLNKETKPVRKLWELWSYLDVAIIPQSTVTQIVATVRASFMNLQRICMKIISIW